MCVFVFVLFAIQCLTLTLNSTSSRREKKENIRNWSRNAICVINIRVNDCFIVLWLPIYSCALCTHKWCMSVCSIHACNWLNMSMQFKFGTRFAWFRCFRCCCCCCYFHSFLPFLLQSGQFAVTAYQLNRSSWSTHLHYSCCGNNVRAYCGSLSWLHWSYH